jgi:hypothetical protein
MARYFQIPLLYLQKIVSIFAPHSCAAVSFFSHKKADGGLAIGANPPSIVFLP